MEYPKFRGKTGVTMDKTESIFCRAIIALKILIESAAVRLL